MLLLTRKLDVERVEWKVRILVAGPKNLLWSGSLQNLGIGFLVVEVQIVARATSLLQYKSSPIVKHLDLFEWCIAKGKIYSIAKLLTTAT